jgi:hypothetical protein
VARKRKPAIWWLRWSRQVARWALYHGAVLHSTYHAPGDRPRTKKESIRFAASTVKAWAELNGRAPARLNICGVGTGSRVLEERSYFCDRRDRKG